MPSLWPFRRNKKKKLAYQEEKSQEKQDASKSPASITTKNINSVALEAQRIGPLELPGSSFENETNLSHGKDKLPPRETILNQRSIARSPTEPIPREPLVEIHDLAGARNNTHDFSQLEFLSHPHPEQNYITQPLYGIPTLRSKRSSATSEILRSKSNRSKSSIKEREKEIKALASSIPIPKRPASFSSSPLARDSKKITGGLDRRLQRPTSEVSLPMAESLRTSLSGDSVVRQHSFKVSAFDALSPRPTIRYGERPNLAAVREKSSRSALRKDKGVAIPEESTMPANPRARIKEMADNMDARTIRELMERDKRRRDRKRALDSDKLKRKLQQKLDKQKAEEAAAREVAVPVELEGTSVPFETDMTVEQYIPYMDDERFETNSPISRRDTETSGRWTREMSQEDLTPMDPFSDPRSDSRNEPRMSSEQTSIQDEAIIESATAIRLSTISTSPPASPLLSRERTMSPSNLSNVAMAPRDSPEPSIPRTGYLHPELRREPETDAKPSSSWTSIFRRAGTKRKVSTEKQQELAPAASEFSNVSRESFLRKNQPPSIPVVQRSFQREPTVHRKQSKFREDLPELPISPPRSQVQSPDLDRPLSPYVDDSRKLDDLNNNNNSVATPIEDVHPALRDQLSHSRQQSFQTSSPEPVLLSQSLASIDSEASWLSGRPQKRSSVPIGSVRESLASLTQPREENKDQYDEPDFSRQEFGNNTIRGPGGLSAQLRAMHPTSADSDTSLRHDAQPLHDEAVKYDTVIGRRPKIIQGGSIARSREGLLDEYNPTEEESPVSPLSPVGGEPDFPMTAGSSIHRATSVKVRHSTGHARQLSAGSARLLDIPARSSSDAKRASVISAASTTKSPLVSPRESTIYSNEPQ